MAAMSPASPGAPSTRLSLPTLATRAAGYPLGDALFKAHLLRELTFLHEQSKQPWAGQMADHRRLGMAGRRPGTVEHRRPEMVGHRLQALPGMAAGRRL